MSKKKVPRYRLESYLQVPPNLRRLILDKNLSQAEIVTLLQVFEQTVGRGRRATRLSNHDIAKANNVDERTAIRIRASLKKHGLLNVDLSEDCRQTHEPALVSPNFPMIETGSEVSTKDPPLATDTDDSSATDMEASRATGAGVREIHLDQIQDEGRQADYRAAPKASRIPGRTETEGVSELEQLLGRDFVRFRSDEILVLLESGRSLGLTTAGTVAFVEHKLKQKRDQGDPVQSIALLKRAIRDPGDFHRWAAKSSKRTSFFIQPTLQEVPLPATAEAIRVHLSRCASQIRGTGMCEEIAVELELLAGTLDEKTELAQLEDRLIALEERMVGIAQPGLDTVSDQYIRREFKAHLNAYGRRMSTEQLSSLERQHRARLVLERRSLPRLSISCVCDSSTRAA